MFRWLAMPAVADRRTRRSAKPAESKDVSRQNAFKKVNSK